MDFSDTPEEAAFRAEARAWLAANAPPFERPAGAAIAEDELIAIGKAWTRRKSEAHFAAVTLPRALGGRDGTPMQSVIFAQEEARYRIPTNQFFGVGVKMALPTIRAHGAPAQLERFAGPTLRGEIQWSQLFSEPGAGSDLAGVRTRARRDGDRWIVNGQKIWSSWAHRSDWGLLLARSDPSVPKHAGLTFFVVDMKSPGLEVRPIKQINGHSDFNETFFTDVVIPDDCRIGAEGQGWQCVMTTLTSERGGAADPEFGIRDLIRAARQTPRRNGAALDSAAVRLKLAQWYAEEQGVRNFNLAVLTRLSRGEPAGADVALLKLITSTKMQQTAAFEMDLGEFGGLFESPDAPRQPNVFDNYLRSAELRIAGGADEVLRNQLAERVLGMPGDARPDKGVPFDSLPT
jgi:alkylation response protein AidB-like acyl-CoA dehydrogenase